MTSTQTVSHSLDLVRTKTYKESFFILDDGARQARLCQRSASRLSSRLIWVNRDYQHLLPHLQRVELSLGEVVYTAGRRIENVYFLEDAVISLLSTLESGGTTEVGLIGYEGMVGLHVFLGEAVTPEQAVVLLSGTAMKMKASVLREELRVGSPLQLLLLRYTRVFIAPNQSIRCL